MILKLVLTENKYSEMEFTTTIKLEDIQTIMEENERFKQMNIMLNLENEALELINNTPHLEDKFLGSEYIPAKINIPVLELKQTESEYIPAKINIPVLELKQTESEYIPAEKITDNDVDKKFDAIVGLIDNLKVDRWSEDMLKSYIKDFEDGSWYNRNSQTYKNDPKKLEEAMKHSEIRIKNNKTLLQSVELFNKTFKK